MNVEITLYTFAKKPNSTKQPTLGIGATILSCTLKAGCSILAPVFEFKALFNNNLYQYNYAYIPLFNRYYYINDWSYNMGLWVASMYVDTLASFKSDIGALDAYVVRSSYDADGNVIYNSNIVDNAYPVTAEKSTYTYNAVATPFGGDDDAAGCYIVSVINSSSENGCVTYYAMTQAEFNTFNSYVFTQNWQSISDISTELTHALVDPYKYVVGVKFCPFTTGQLIQRGIISTTVGRKAVKFGYWSVPNLTAYTVYNWQTITGTISIPIPKHPYSASRGSYYDLSPFTVYTLKFYPYGTITIDSNILRGYNTIELEYKVDITTGYSLLNFSVAGATNVFKTVQANVFIPLPTASMQMDYNAVNMGTLSAATGLAIASNTGLKEGFKGGWNTLKETKDLSAAWNTFKSSVSGSTSVGEVANGIVSAARSMLSNVDIQAEQSAIGMLWGQVILSARFYYPPTEDFDHTGRPLCQHKQISDLSGYIQIQDDDIALPCTTAEASEISAFLNSGFYYE